jgi:hypothetical protein
MSALTEPGQNLTRSALTGPDRPWITDPDPSPPREAGEERTTMTTYYMHTLDGQPASFAEKDGGIFFPSGNAKVRLVRSLATIRREQNSDREWCAARGVAPLRYGYVRVEVPRD